MAIYTGTPKTWAVEEELTASDFNAEFRDPLLALTGAENAYTPTVSGFTLGNGTVSGAYIRVGKWIYFRCRLTFGSTTTAATGPCSFTLPVTGNGNAGLFVGEFYDATGSRYTAHCRQGSTTTVSLYLLSTSGAGANLSTTSPFTWTTSDGVAVWGIYTAA